MTLVSHPIKMLRTSTVEIVQLDMDRGMCYTGTIDLRKSVGTLRDPDPYGTSDRKLSTVLEAVGSWQLVSWIHWSLCDFYDEPSS